jgi:hypothetical protein
MFFALAALVFVPSYTIIVVWDKERLLLKRESANGAYRCAAAGRHVLFLVCSCSCCETLLWQQPDMLCPLLHRLLASLPAQPRHGSSTAVTPMAPPTPTPTC